MQKHTIDGLSAGRYAALAAFAVSMVTAILTYCSCLSSSRAESTNQKEDSKHSKGLK